MNKRPGIASERLVAAGKGENAPVARNDSAAGRQQNRRVEVIIDRPPAAALRSLSRVSNQRTLS